MAAEVLVISATKATTISSFPLSSPGSSSTRLARSFSTGSTSWTSVETWWSSSTALRLCFNETLKRWSQTKAACLYVGPCILELLMNVIHIFNFCTNGRQLLWKESNESLADQFTKRAENIFSNRELRTYTSTVTGTLSTTHYLPYKGQMAIDIIRIEKGKQVYRPQAPLQGPYEVHKNKCSWVPCSKAAYFRVTKHSRHPISKRKCMHSSCQSWRTGTRLRSLENR